MKVLITGGRSDLARSMVASLLAKKYQVWVSSSQKDQQEKILNSYHDDQLKISGVCTYDFSKQKQDCQFFNQLVNDGLEGLVLNSFTRMPPIRKFHQFKLDKIKSEIELNLLGNMYLIHHFLPQMKEAQFGRIVLISSASVENGSTNYSTYITAKAALEGLMKNLAVEYGHENILSNTLRLGIFKTSRTEKYWGDKSYRQKVESIIPQGKLGEPAEMAKCLELFLSKKQYINGACLNITGGLPMLRSSGVFGK